jgi:hypothetical protein
MGFNPGGDPSEKGASYPSLRDAIDGSGMLDSAYVIQKWGKAYAEGQHPHQKRVVKMIMAAGIEPASVFSMNACLIRSSKTSDLPSAWQLWSKHFWPIHQKSLAVVRPKVILTLGNGEGTTAFGMLLNQAVPGSVLREPTSNFRNGKFVRAKFASGSDEIEPLIIGAPHPSWYDVPKTVVDRLRAEIAEAAASQ